MISTYGFVRMLVDKEGSPGGSQGIAVSLYATEPVCKVELWDENEQPLDVVTYLPGEVAEVRSGAD